METSMSNTDLEKEITDTRIQDLEQAVIKLNEQVRQISHVLKDAQSIIIKIATSQQQVMDRVKTWPYVVIDKNDDSTL